MSTPAQNGLEAESACRWGRYASSPSRIGRALSRSSRPTCTWMPQIIMLRPHQRVRSMSLWYRGLSVRRWSYHWLKGWDPLQTSSYSPSSSITARTSASCPSRSATASATRSCTPLTSSTVLVSSSEVIDGCRPPSLRSSSSSSTRSAMDASSPVARSTIATSHSSPSVERADRANSMCMRGPPPGRRMHRRRLIMACELGDYPYDAKSARIVRWVRAVRPSNQARRIPP